MPRPYGKHRLANIDPENRVATCAWCGPTAIRLKRNPNGSVWRCLIAEGQWKSPRHARWRISGEEYQRLLDQQGGRCAICRREERLIMVEHNHQTGEVRGLTCRWCNNVLQHVDADPGFLDRLVKYVGQG